MEKTKPNPAEINIQALIYGEPKLGKTTFASELPGECLIVDAERGAKFLTAFVQQVKDWEDFREVVKQLKNHVGEFPYKYVAIDTISSLARMCMAYVVNKRNIEHPSDLDYGKGWNLVAVEWAKVFDVLLSTGLSIIYVAHAKVTEAYSTKALTKSSCFAPI